MYFQEEWKEEIDLLKLEGLDAVRQFVDAWSHVDLFEWKLMSISGETATKLILGEFERFEELEKYSRFDQDDIGDNKINILYREIDDPAKDDVDRIIETIFINE